jgi:hypothetical protein
MDHEFSSDSDQEQLFLLKQRLQGKKILHLGSLAGWPFTLAYTMRQMGLDSENVIHAYRDVDSLERKLPFDYALYSKNTNPIVKLIRIFLFLIAAPSKYGLIHYHSSNIFLREIHFLLEGPLFKLFRIPMVLSLGGGDSRLVYITRRYNKYFFRKWYGRDFLNRIRWFSWSKYISLCATDQELGKIARLFMSNVSLMRQPIDISKINSSTNCEPETPLTIMHVPTQPWKKGSDIILNTLNLLKDEGFEINIIYKQNLSQEVFLDLLCTADIYIDELLCGAHGVTSVESMACGNITCTYIREDLVSDYPADLPIVNVNPDNLYCSIKKLLLLPRSSLQQLKVDSRRYALRYHSSLVVCRELINKYNALF